MAGVEEKIVVGLHRVTNALDRETARLCGRYGLTLGQFAVLEALDHAGELTVGQVKEKVLSTDGTIPVVVRNLERRGCVTSAPDPADARRKLLRLTGAGRALIEEAYPRNGALIADAMGVLTHEEERQLLALLKKLGGR